MHQWMLDVVDNKSNWKLNHKTIFMKLICLSWQRTLPIRFYNKVAYADSNYSQSWFQPFAY